MKTLRPVSHALTITIAIASSLGASDALASDYLEPGDHTECSEGFYRVTYADALVRQQELCNQIGTWDIVRLDDGGSMDGSGYGCEVRPTDGRALGATLCSDEPTTRDIWSLDVDAARSNSNYFESSTTIGFYNDPPMLHEIDAFVPYTTEEVHALGKLLVAYGRELLDQPVGAGVIGCDLPVTVEYDTWASDHWLVDVVSPLPAPVVVSQPAGSWTTVSMNQLDIGITMLSQCGIDATVTIASQIGATPYTLRAYTWGSSLETSVHTDSIAALGTLLEKYGEHLLASQATQSGAAGLLTTAPFEVEIQYTTVDGVNYITAAR